MTRSLTALLNPKSIAFISGTECDVAIRRTRELGFPGKIWAVHPKRESLGGIACVRSVAEIEGALDAAFVAIKREPTIEVVRELRKKGCGGAVIYASGFAETGDAHLQKELLEAADGMPLMGPNCYGFVNCLARVAPFTVDADAGPPGAPPPNGGATVLAIPNNHLSYALTWFGLAATLAAVFAVYARRRLAGPK